MLCSEMQSLQYKCIQSEKKADLHVAAVKLNDQ